MRFSLGYPTPEEEIKMLDMLRQAHPLTQIKAVATAEELVACQQAVRQVHVDEKVRRYIVEIIHRTRKTKIWRMGPAPGFTGVVSHLASHGCHAGAEFRPARRH